MYKVQILPKAEEDICTKSAPPLRCAFLCVYSRTVTSRRGKPYMQHTEARTQPPHCGSCVCRYGRYEEQNGTAKEQYGVDDGSPRTCRGLITADIPRINRMLNRLEPMALPSASPLSPFFVATMEVTSSGREVPMAIMVSPMKFWLTPKFVAMMQALSTTRSPTEDNGSQTSGNIQKAAGQGEDLAGFALFSVFSGQNRS